MLLLEKPKTFKNKIEPFWEWVGNKDLKDLEREEKFKSRVKESFEKRRKSRQLC